MKSLSVFFIFEIVYLAGLYIFHSIFSSVLLGAFYILIYKLSRYFWKKRGIDEFKLIINPIINFITATFLGLGLYILLFLPIEFFLTEISMKIERIPSLISTILLVAVIIFLNEINWRKHLTNKLNYSVLVTFIALDGLIFLWYGGEKLKREYLPKIYNIDPKWGIQAQLVTIKGVNFGAAWQSGKIRFEDQEMTVVSWEEDKIIFEQPVPKKFEKGKLFVLRKDEVRSNNIDFEIKDPAYLIKQ